MAYFRKCGLSDNIIPAYTFQQYRPSESFYEEVFGAGFSYYTDLLSYTMNYDQSYFFLMSVELSGENMARQREPLELVCRIICQSHDR